MPLSAVPVDGAFAPLSEPGRRVLAAADGIYVEARSLALYVRQRVAEIALPYGAILPALALLHGPIPRVVFRGLKELALSAHPNEMAALVLADPSCHGAYRVTTPDGSASTGSVRYDDTGYDENLLVIDAHSHGFHRAIFSATDDRSDRSRLGPHISVVFGACQDETSYETAVRVCIGPYLIPITLGALGALSA